MNLLCTSAKTMPFLPLPTEWFLKVREKDARLDGPLLREKAEWLVKTLGRPDFKVTEAWFQRWKKRKNIFGEGGGDLGEQGNTDSEAACGWHETQRPELTAYSPANIFNADGAGLYFRALCEHT